MKISKRDALTWFQFFAELPEGEQLFPAQQEIVYSTLYQIETAVEKRFQKLQGEIKNLKTLANRTYYVGDDALFPQGCKSCLCGTGLSAVRKTNKCNANCPFCYDYGCLNAVPPIGEGMWDLGGARYREEDIELLLSIDKRPTGIAYVYLEPFMEIEKYYGIIRRFAAAGVHQHMYTNGINANAENLRALGEAGLNEFRFNLGATNFADKIIEKIAIAKKYIPHVGIETPMTREAYGAFIEKRDKIISTGAEFVNLAELHLTPNNCVNYEGESVYMYRHGYISPIASRELTLKLMKIASEENWEILLHDCSNRTKFARDINLKAKEGGWFGASAYGREFDEIPYALFLPTLMDEGVTFAEEEPLPGDFMGY